jgi:trimeric autotransporter adhesin
VGSHAAPTLSSTDQSTITAGSGNLTITVTGSGFLPGATVLWNGSPRTTTYVDSSHVTVAVPASDVKAAVAGSLSCQNPGSGVSDTITVTVQ